MFEISETARLIGVSQCIMVRLNLDKSGHPGAQEERKIYD